MPFLADEVRKHQTALSRAFASHREVAEKAEREACAKVAEAKCRLAHDGSDLTGSMYENMR